MDELLSWIAELTGAERARRGQRIQSLWGGYGELWRIELRGAATSSAILKWVEPPPLLPRTARKSERSHRRKLRSYAVETGFYRSFAPRCDERCRVPALLGSRAGSNRWALLLEDLDAGGFSGRTSRPNGAQLDACLAWLAAFHARFLGVAPDGLWKTGTYWHLATRPDELAALADTTLRAGAAEWDRALSASPFQTLVHGDAKPANFCFAKRGGGVAAVDFQYVGGGCGMKDVAYLLHGEASPGRHLDAYFTHLRSALASEASKASVESEAVDAAALERDWRALYPIAVSDFSRFLAGWR